MPGRAEDSELEFARVAKAISMDPRVDRPEAARAKGFGSKGLKVERRLFAFHSKGRLVVKLPAARVDTLLLEGKGERFDPGHGRLMKEWIAFGYADRTSWLKFAREALDCAEGGKKQQSPTVAVSVPAAPRGRAPARRSRRRSSSAARR